MIRMLIFTVGFCGMAMLSVSIIPTVPVLRMMSMPAMLAVLCVIYFEEKWQWLCVVVLGVLLALFSVLPFYFQILGLAAAVFIVRMLYKRFFTNRSIYGMVVLTAVGTGVYQAIIAAGFVWERFANANHLPGLEVTMLWSIVANVVLSITFFYGSMAFLYVIQRMFLLRRSR